MAVMRGRRAGAAALAGLAVLLLLCLFSAVAVAEEKKLYPSCGGREYAATTRASEETTLAAFSYSYDGISLDCLAYEVTSLKGGQTDQTKDHCLIAHQTEYAYSLVLRAAYTDDYGNRITRDFSIRDMTGGSLTEITTRMPRASRYSIVFKNLGTSDNCNLKIRALVSLMAAPDANVTGVVPTVVALEPRTVYTKDSPRTFLVLDYGSGNPPSRNDVVTLVDYTTGTCAYPRGDILSMDYSSLIPSTVHMPGDIASYSARTTTFYNPNTYRVCFRGDGAANATEIAVLTAFSGNPAYYEVVKGQDDEGRVMVGDEATIKFYGYDLDTRAKGDEAKFVWFTEECDSGKPAAGVPLADNLGPADNYGPNTTYSLWTWTMKEEGAFKVCYKRKATDKWTEVPSIEDVGPAAEDDSAPADVPDPTDPATKEKCPKLNYNAEKPWKKYKSVQVTLNSKSVPDNLYATLSKLLCLPQNMFTITLSRSTAKGYKNVFLYLGCDLTGNEGICDTTERLNYFTTMQDSLLAEHGITEVVGSTSMFAYDDDNVIPEARRSSGVLIFCSVCVLAGGGMAVYAVSRYQERRHHFNQFGLEEEDIDDMYDFSAAAAGPATREHYEVPGVPAPPPQRIQNAVIEIED